MINEESFLAGPSATRQLFVVLGGEQAQEAAIEEGQTPSVNGVVRQLSSADEA